MSLTDGDIVRIALVIGVLLATRGAVSSAQDDPGVAVIRAMHDRYATTWYHTLVFDQRTTRRTPAGKDTVEQWHEAARAPADLRIEQGAIADGNGALTTHDSTFLVKGGTVIKRRSGGNPLITFLLSVYLVPVEQTVADMRSEGYDLSKVHDEQWDGRAAVVIGAGAGDTTSAQLWVDKERLIAVRRLGPLAPGSTKVWDLRFNKYRRIGGGWVSAECAFYTGGIRAQLEEYYNIKADISLDPSLFDATQWMTAKHW